MKTGLAYICGNFASKGQCGTCEHMLLAGCVTGNCEVDDYRKCVTTDKCFCGKYKEGTPQE